MIKIEFNKTDKYDLIYGEWIMGYNDDARVVDFLQKARVSLEDITGGPGTIICKETIRTSKDEAYCSKQHYVNRTKEEYKALFSKAGYRIVRQTQTPMTYGENSTISHMFAI